MKQLKQLGSKFFILTMILLLILPPELSYASTTVGNSGGSDSTGTQINSIGGIRHIERPVFRVGLSRSPDLFNTGKKEDQQKMVDAYSYRHPSVTAEVYFKPRGTEAMYTNAWIGEYDAGQRRMVVNHDAAANQHFLSTESAYNIGKDLLNGYSLEKNYNLLADSNSPFYWKTKIVPGFTKAHALSMWSYILGPQSYSVGNSSTYDIRKRLDAMISPYTNKYGTEGITDAEMKDISNGYLSLLISLYVLTEGTAKSQWALAVEDFLNQKNTNIKGNPPTIVIDTAVNISYNTRGEQIVAPTIDYFMSYAALGQSNNYYNTTTVQTGNVGNTYDSLFQIVDKDVVAEPSLFRTSNRYDENNALSRASALFGKPGAKITTLLKRARWVKNTSELNYFTILNYGTGPNGPVEGFMTVGFAMDIPPDKDIPEPKPPIKGVLEVTPDEKPVGSDLIGENTTLNITNKIEKIQYNQWVNLFADEPTKNKTVNVKLQIDRTAKPSASTAPSYTSAMGNLLTGVDMPKDMFLKFVGGSTPIVLVDNTSQEPIAAGSRKEFTYKVKMSVTYENRKGEKVTLTTDMQDPGSFVRAKEPPEYIGFTSDVVTFSEMKDNRPDSENFNGMAGVPSNKRLYLGVGGSEFIVDVELEYKENVDSVWRTYRSYFSGTPSEFKAGDTSPNKQIMEHSVAIHGGGSYTHTWTGSIPNLGQSDTKSNPGDVVATATAVPDRTAYNEAMKAAQEYIKAVNTTYHSHTAASDGITREESNWGAHISTDAPNDPKTIVVTNSCWGTQSDGKGGTIPKALPCTATATKDGPGSFTIVVTFIVPNHRLCGPECTYDLPLVEDNWKQRINYDYLRISRLEVYKIESGRIVQVDDLFGNGNDELRATITAGTNPNIFYNISQENANGNDKAAQSSFYARLRYSLETGQHDNVVWNEGTRTNKSAGEGDNGSGYAPQGGGHTKWWATQGILYDNKTQTTEVDYHRAKTGIKSSTSNIADGLDTATPEWKKFDERRRSLNTATIISDMLILQTSSGDQAVMYFDIKSKTVQSQEQFPDVRVSKETMWDNNPNSAAKWKDEQIYMGSYNGKFKETATGSQNNKKFWGYNRVTNSFVNNHTRNKVVPTAYDDNGAGIDFANKRPKANAHLEIFGSQAIVPTTPNDEYKTGKTTTFYKRLVTWKTPTPYEEFPGLTLREHTYKGVAQKDFFNAVGVVYNAPYSEDHVKTNDIVIHTPVSVQDAMLISSPDYLDQRTDVPDGGAKNLIDEEQKKINDHNNALTVPDFGIAVDKIITSTVTTQEKVVDKTPKVTDFKYTGGIQTFTAPVTGTYTLETWGAQGGSGYSSSQGGKGGYSQGNVNLTKGQVLYIAVGGQGVPTSGSSFTQTPVGGWNGGGNGNGDAGAWGGAGGGATHIAKSTGQLQNLSANKSSVLIVAGGGGGGGHGTAGGAGGGTSGIAGTSGATVGSQSSGYAFGLGQSSTVHDAGAGGGGWYGAYASQTSDASTGGGSGYIGGVTNAKTLAGNQTMPTPTGGNQVGHTGNGYARITTVTTDTGNGGWDNNLTKVTTNTQELSYGDKTGAFGWTWEQLFGAGWRNYIEVKTTTDTTTSVTTKEEEAQDTPVMTKPVTFNYTGSVQTFTAPKTGAYTLEVWGAEGGGSRLSGNTYSGYGGAGGYSKGTVQLTAGQTVYVYVGGYGRSSISGTASGGWNGGGSGYASGEIEPGNGGGGATDFRVGDTALSSRVIVAGGGGGGGEDANDPYGHGGGSSGTGYVGYDATQTIAGPNGSFGQGASTYYGDGGGGGGGYYGGGTAQSTSVGGDTQGGGGGSGYIGKVTQGTTVNGTSLMPSPTGGNQYGHLGNGVARISAADTGTGGGTGTGTPIVGTPTNFGYTGSVQSFTAPYAGEYQLEVWGAEGGTSPGYGIGGRGGYAKGVVSLSKGETVYVYVGEKGINGGSGDRESFNGGAAPYTNHTYTAGGGGATDIRLSSGAWNNTTGLYSRIIVAGGGGGGGAEWASEYAGFGGGLTGGDAGWTNGNNPGTQGRGGTQSSAGGPAYGGFGYGGRSTTNQSGSGGGGWYGGGGQVTSPDAGGGGGSGYVLTATSYKPAGYTVSTNYYLTSTDLRNGGLTQPSPTSGTQVGQSGNGYAKITPLTQVNESVHVTQHTTTTVTITTTTSVLEEKVKTDLHLFPDRMPDGSWNPVKRKFGQGEPGDKNIADNTVTTTDGKLIKTGTFINIDSAFQIYFPNRGDFLQQPNLRGIPETVITRGYGYTNAMDTTQYTQAKRVKFNFNVIYEGELYFSNAWIDLNVPQEYFDFYAVLANNEAVAAKIEYDAIAINAQPVEYPVNDNDIWVTNKHRFDNFTAYHGAIKRSYVDVVGRIGNFAVSDTEDFRFSNFFKVPVAEDKWILEGIVKEVHMNRQRMLFGDVVDIRGKVAATTGVNLNTYGSQKWLELETHALPVNPSKNVHPALTEQFIKTGYDIFSDISTTGNYTDGVLRVLPYYYKLDVNTGEITPLDVYQQDADNFYPVNLYRGADGGNLPENLYLYNLILDWNKESLRRNFGLEESLITDIVAETYGEYEYGIVPNPDIADGYEEGITGYQRLTTPSGSFAHLGNAQRVVLDKSARTFIGNTETYGEDKNPGGRMEEYQYYFRAQRWHMKLGLPASSVFVEAGKVVNQANIEEVLNGNGVLLLAADIIAIGEVYTLRYDQLGIDSITVTKEGQTHEFNIRNSGLPPIIALYDLETSAVIDVDVQNSH